MGAARMGSGPLSRLNSPSKRACMQSWLRDGLGAGLRGSGAWQAPGGGANARGVAKGQGPMLLGSGASQAVGETPGNDPSAGSRIRDPGAEESSLGRSRVWPGAPVGWRRSAQRVRRGESFEPRAASESNPHRQQWPRLQIARESVHGIDAGETAPPERPGARLLEHFCSQLVRQHPGDQSGPTQQGRSAGVPEAEEIPPNHQAEQRSSEGQASPQGASGLYPLSCSQSPPFFRCPLCPVEAPMIPALGIPVLTQALLPRGNQTSSTSSL